MVRVEPSGAEPSQAESNRTGIVGSSRDSGRAGRRGGVEVEFVLNVCVSQFGSVQSAASSGERTVCSATGSVSRVYSFRGAEFTSVALSVSVSVSASASAF